MESGPRELEQALGARPDPEHGAQLFRNCAVCHGIHGGGTTDGGVPRIAGQHVSVILKQLVDYRHDQRWDIRMEHFADRHHLANAQAMADVAAYVHSLTPDTPPGAGDGQLVEQGAALYSRKCASCHGLSGEGSATRRIPRLAGQHFEYLQRQIYDAVDHRRPNFSRGHIRMLAKLQREDIVGLADFLSRQLPTQKTSIASQPAQATAGSLEPTPQPRSSP